MRILTLLGGPSCVAETAALSREIRSFNAGIDFRLRFLDIGIEEVVLGLPQAADAFRKELEDADLRSVEAGTPLLLAARLALRIQEQRPDLLVVAGSGELVEPALAAAEAVDVRTAVYGTGRAEVEGALDLGDQPPVAVERMTGVAREIA